MSKKQYTFWYIQSIVSKAGFNADSLEEAQGLLAKVFDEGELALEDLPEFWSKDKNYEIEYAPETLKDWTN